MFSYWKIEGNESKRKQQEKKEKNKNKNRFKINKLFVYIKKKLNHFKICKFLYNFIYV